MVRGLGELEATIMDRMWSYRRPALVREVTDDLAGSGNQAATLVHFLERLTPEEAAAMEAALRVIPPSTKRS